MAKNEKGYVTVKASPGYEAVDKLTKVCDVVELEQSEEGIVAKGKSCEPQAPYDLEKLNSNQVEFLQVVQKNSNILYAFNVDKDFVKKGLKSRAKYNPKI